MQTLELIGWGLIILLLSIPCILGCVYLSISLLCDIKQTFSDFNKIGKEFTYNEIRNQRKN